MPKLKKLDATAGRLAKAGKISSKAFKKLKMKTVGKLPKVKTAKRGSDIPIGVPRGGTAKGMAGR
jgi:hypothetical protein